MSIRRDSLANKIFRAIKSFANEMGDAAYYMGPTFRALMSRKTLGKTLSAMGGYEREEAGFSKNFSATLGRLKKSGFIKFYDRDRFTLTDKGKGVLVKFDIDNFTLPDFEPAKWDDVWRVIIFDIPELTRAVRNLFRDKIQELGFYTLQKSVYVTPIACEKEITSLSKILKIADGVDILHVSKLGRRDKAVRKFFGIG